MSRAAPRWCVSLAGSTHNPRAHRTARRYRVIVAAALVSFTVATTACTSTNAAANAVQDGGSADAAVVGVDAPIDACTVGTWESRSCGCEVVGEVHCTPPRPSGSGQECGLDHRWGDFDDGPCGAQLDGSTVRACGLGEGCYCSYPGVRTCATGTPLECVVNAWAVTDASVCDGADGGMSCGDPGVHENEACPPESEGYPACSLEGPAVRCLGGVWRADGLCFPRDGDSDVCRSAPGTEGCPCETLGAINCTSTGGGLECTRAVSFMGLPCRAGVAAWAAFLDGPCAPPPDAGGA